MIRLATEADLPAILEIYAPYVLHTTVTFEYNVPTLSEFTARFQKITAQFPWLVWEEQGKILGYAYGSAPFERAAYSWTGEPSIYLAPDARHKGIGRRLYAALEELMKLQGYRLLLAIITEENANSLAFHVRMGYTFRAQFPACALKFGRWLGITWMEKELFSGEIPSKAPIPFPAIVKNNRNFTKILDKMTLS